MSMGFLFSLIYFAISFLTPEALFGSLAQYHIQFIIAGLTLFFSIPKLIQSSILKVPQTLALICLAFAGFFSSLFGQHWLGGAVTIYIEFVSRIMAFFFIYLNFDTKKRLRALVIVLFVISLFVIARGTADLVSMSGSYGPPIDPSRGSADLPQWNAAHPYLYPMSNSEGQWFYRIRGLGMINDPNDFAQLLLCLVPLMFIFWRPKKPALNFAFVLIPVAMLLAGIFLTHSRGALLALTVMALIAGRRKVGTVPAIILATGFFAAAMALQFSGGRQISATAGEDRTALWGEGIAAFRTHPLFGVGYDNLPAYTDSNLTAHNTVIVCAAELGLVGFYFWSIFLFATLKDAYATSSPNKIKDGEPVARDDVQYPQPASVMESLDKEDINILGRSVFLSLVGYLVAGWFLSRAIVITLFMLGGIAEVIYQMALKRGMVSKRIPSIKLLPQSAALAVGLLVTLYVVVRALNFVR
jgi:hypothetical protein